MGTRSETTVGKESTKDTTSGPMRARWKCHALVSVKEHYCGVGVRGTTSKQTLDSEEKQQNWLKCLTVSLSKIKGGSSTTLPFGDVFAYV